MKPRTVYAVLCVLGMALPYWEFVPWLWEHHFAWRLFLDQLFANRISAFFGLDVIVSAAVLIAFVKLEGGRLAIPRPWLPVLATLLVGVSLGFPLFLYLREARLEQQTR